MEPLSLIFFSVSWACAVPARPNAKVMTAAADINVFFIRTPERAVERWNGRNGILGMQADRLSRISPESRVCAEGRPRSARQRPPTGSSAGAQNRCSRGLAQERPQRRGDRLGVARDLR